MVLDGTTASLRWQRKLAGGWKFVAHAATQQPRSDDRIAFPFGCFDPNPAPNGTYYADRYCPNGNFDLYDFRSDGERRRSDALDLNLSGKLRTGAVEHAVSAGILSSRVKNRFGADLRLQRHRQRRRQHHQPAGQPGAERLQHQPRRTLDRAQPARRHALRRAQHAVAGLRHTRLQRASERNDPTDPRATDYASRSPRPSSPPAMLGAGPTGLCQLGPRRRIRRGANRALRQRRRDLHADEPADRIRPARQPDAVEWNAALFDIRRPRPGDFGSCDVDASCVRRPDGEQRHRGLGGRRHAEPGRLDAARRRPVAARPRAGLVRPGGRWQMAPTHQRAGTHPQAAGRPPPRRPARPDAAGRLHRREPSPRCCPTTARRSPAGRASTWRALDTRWAGNAVTWRAGVDNVADRRAWRESPYQFGHAYLFPLEPRTFRVSVQADL